jgi:hypothetical protein
MDSAQASNALSCSVLRVRAYLSTSPAHALVMAFGAGSLRCIKPQGIRDNANTICVIAADDAAKEDLEGRRVAEGEDDAKGLTRELHGLGKSIACGACRRAE